ncbi:uncharacterized protein [Littorina saxatilis]|uniref:Uncharacterized protein n=1 Tax=Littorina saxatilis TaxID=31220 RepID=A0AAN9B6V8_9CAEN
MAPISPRGDELAGLAFFVPQHEIVNGTTDSTSQEGHLVMVNGTLIRILLKKPYRDSEANELLYVIIVIVFYATALMTLIITQIKRQRREGSDVDYYDEYLQRNQEVKRTCQTATTLVKKADPKMPSSTTVGTASTSVSGERGSSVSLLLEPPARGRDLSPRSAQRYLLSGRGGYGGGVGGGGFEDKRDAPYPSPSVSPRELSPMLESIPDIGT